MQQPSGSSDGLELEAGDAPEVPASTEWKLATEDVSTFETGFVIDDPELAFLLSIKKGQHGDQVFVKGGLATRLLFTFYAFALIGMRAAGCNRLASFVAAAITASVTNKVCFVFTYYIEGHGDKRSHVTVSKDVLSTLTSMEKNRVS